MKIVHGGDLDSVVRHYGIRREDIKDYSGNINPFGVSEKVKTAILDNIDKVSTYPDANYQSLRESISEYTGISAKNIIVGNGSTELISLFIKSSLKRKKALIMAPAYSEYEREISLLGGKSVYFPLKESNYFNTNIPDLLDCLHEKLDLLVICNPNNPTGTAIARTDMTTVLEKCSSLGIRVLIDETYCEFADEDLYSSIPLINSFNNIIVIRGIAKFFAAPGLRLGYAIAGDSIIKEMKKAQLPWSVNIFGAIAGEHLFKDSEYIIKTKSFITGERQRVFNTLSKFGNIQPYKSQTNFQLFKIMDQTISSKFIFETLIKKGMLVRNAESFMYLDSSFIRFCLLQKEDNTRLLKELGNILSL